MAEPVFTGFEGIVTPDILRQQRLLERQKSRAVRQTQKRGQELFSAEAGAFAGQAITDALRRLAPRTFDPAGVKAQRAQQAIESAREQVPDEGDPLEQRIALVSSAIGEMKSRGLHAEADQLRGNLLQLQSAQLERRKLAGEIQGQQLDNFVKTQTARLKAGEAPGRDETTRLLNRLESLSATDPADARQRDFILKRLNKLTEVTGRTEFDVDDKKLFRSSLEDVATAQEGLSRINGVIESFDPRYLTLQGRVENFAMGTADFLDLPMPQEAKRAYADYKTWQTRTVTNLNLYIKEITGAQMSVQEASRLSKGLPNENDSPVAFAAKAQETQAVLQASLERAEAIARADAAGDAGAKIEARKIDIFKRAEEIMEAQEPVDTAAGEQVDPEQVRAEARAILGL